MIDTHFKSQQKLILHFDTEKILKQPPIILLDGNRKSFATIFRYFFLKIQMLNYARKQNQPL